MEKKIQTKNTTHTPLAGDAVTRAALAASDEHYRAIMSCLAERERLRVINADLLAAAKLGLRNELLCGAFSECAAREQDHARMTVEAIQTNRALAKSYRDEMQENFRKIRATIIRAEAR